MKARKYDKRIEVWETGQRVADGFGGWKIGSLKIAVSWAQLLTEGLGRKAHSFGLVEFNDPLLFKVRGRNDLHYNGRNLFLVYAGNNYIIKGVRNEGMRGVDTEIFCVQERPETIEKTGVITT